MPMTATDWTPLADAIQALAAACDGARTEDGMGFSAGNAPLGHYLSKVPGELWDDTMAAGAWQICREHKAQLAGHGIEIEDLPVPPEPERDARGELAEQRRAFEASERIRAESVCVLADNNGEQVIVLGFPYDQDMVDEARGLPGRAWKPEFGTFSKVNVFPASSAPQVRSFCDRHGIPVPADVATLADNPPAPPVVEKTPNIYFLTPKTMAIKFDSFPGPDVLAAVKELPGRKWDGERKVWTVPASALSQVCEFAAERGLRLAEDVADAAGGVSEREEWNLGASVALTPSGSVDVPGLSGALKPHQVAGLEFIAANRRVLVGDKMGLGKTLLSLAAVAANGAWPAVVVCKTSLRLNWAAEMARFFPDRTVYVASGNAPAPIPAGTDVVVIGFDVLKQAYKADGVEKPGWAVALAKLKPSALIVDESHFGKEATAARSQAMEFLGKKVAAADGIVLCLSGTAIVNRPKELLQQLRILGRLADVGGAWAFKNRYCGPETNQWGTTYDGATNLNELHMLLRRTGIYLRRGDDALGLPELTIRPSWLGGHDVDAEALGKYRDAEQDFLSALIEQASARGVDLSDPKARAAFCAKAMNAETLVRLNLLRQLAGALKSGAVIERAAQLTTSGEKLMIAAHHRDMVDLYASWFGGLKIQGGQSTESVEADKEAFQNAPMPSAPVITVSTQAGGVGHTLTAAAFGILAELPWTWAEVAQMAGRLHRIGQERPVDFAVMLAEGTVDDYMWRVVSNKRSVTAAVLDGVAEEIGESERAAAAEVMDLMLAEQGFEDRA
jgi:SNF2 domain-containing protein/helicase-like protein